LAPGRSGIVFVVTRRAGNGRAADARHMLERAHQIGHDALANERQRAPAQLVAAAGDDLSAAAGAHGDEQQPIAPLSDDGAADDGVDAQRRGDGVHFGRRSAAPIEPRRRRSIAPARHQLVQLAQVLLERAGEARTVGAADAEQRHGLGRRLGAAAGEYRQQNNRYE
jgi:hypothetical protein